ncbi:MAG: radical SAM family heme chaperone HemW [Eubacteriales bacterium]
MASLYIHVPFCAKKCSYCDFVSFDNQNSRIREYFDVLAEEIRIASAMHKLHGVSTVFFGGGTPSFVDESHIVKTMETVREYIGIEEGAEITIEANPNSLIKEKLDVYLNSGINRLSMGLQSADNRLLKQIGRLHTREMFEQAYADARKAGFANISLDLIYGLPGQTAEDFKDTLEYASGLAPEHISAYSLTIEPGTPLHRDLLDGKITEADEDSEREMYHTAVAYLKSKGWERYEISNFAKKGFESRHNLAYWNRLDYLGVGTAAHSCIRDIRFANTADLDGYISCLRTGNVAYNTNERLDAQQVETEYIMLKLRLQEGFATEEYKTLFGRDFGTAFAAPLEKLAKAGLVKEEGGRIFPTDRGFDLQNTVVLELVNIL